MDKSHFIHDSTRITLLPNHYYVAFLLLRLTLYIIHLTSSFIIYQMSE
jgi:hypothetical protein